METIYQPLLNEQPAELVAITTKQQLPEDLALFTIEKFNPIWSQIQEWKDKAETLVVTDISQTAEMKMAGDARKAVKKVRTSANALREELKADSLRYGRAVQELYNEIEARLKPIEEHLEKQEKFKELYEMKQREALRVEREALIEPLRQYAFTGINFGEITQDDFDMILNNAKLAKQAAEEAARKAEAERIERERIQQLHESRKQSVIHLYAYWTDFEKTLNFGEQSETDFQNFVERLNKLKQEDDEAREALRQENERLKAEAEEKERERQAELDRIEREQRKANIEAANARKAAEAKAAEERKERERIQKELDDKKAAEEKAEAERLAAIEAELSKGDKEKFKDILSRLESIKTDFAFKSKKYKTLHTAMCELIDKTINYANQKI